MRHAGGDNTGEVLVSARWVIVVAVSSVVGLMAVALPRPAADIRAESPVADERIAAVEQYLADTRAEMGWPGLSAALVAGDEVAWAAGFGTSGTDGAEVTADTPFLVASVAKSVTAVAVMRLVEEGRVELSQPVTTHLPELAPAGDEVTVADLMFHRTGVSTSAGHEVFTGASAASLQDNVARLEPLLVPEAPFEYSNANYDALALLVERAAGDSYEEFLQAEVFGPLGMGNATTDPERAREAGLAQGHYHWLLLGYRPHAPPLPAGGVGSYRLFASADDVAQLLLMHLNRGMHGGQRVLSESSVDILQSGEPVAPGAEVTYGGGLTVHPPGQRWMAGDIADHPTLMHDGSSLSSRAVMWAMPRADLGLVLLANANDYADETHLPRAAFTVQQLLFDVEPQPVVRGPDWLRRWSKELLALVAIAQLALGLAGSSPLRRMWQGERPGRSGVGLLTGATVVDVAALLTVLLLPVITGSPFAVVLKAPDARILIAVMLLGVACGVVRTALWVIAARRGSRERAAGLLTPSTGTG